VRQLAYIRVISPQCEAVSLKRLCQKYPGILYCPNQKQGVSDFAAMDGFHVKRVTKHKGNVQFVSEIGDPVPGENTLNRYDDVRHERHNEL